MTEVKIIPGNQPVGIGDGPVVWVNWDDTVGVVHYADPVTHAVATTHMHNTTKTTTVDFEVIKTPGLVCKMVGTPYEAFTMANDRVNEFWIREAS